VNLFQAAAGLLMPWRVLRGSAVFLRAPVSYFDTFVAPGCVLLVAPASQPRKTISMRPTTRRDRCTGTNLRLVDE
jgi:hypothetical protein